MPGAGDGSPAPGPASAGAHAPGSFGQRLAAAVAARESQIVLGIDPDPSRLWPEAAGAADGARTALLAALGVPAAGPGSPELEAAAAVLAHCRALIDAAGPACVAAKPQLACFERLGGAGALALELTCAHARDAGLLVLADGKRGDVPVSARAYSQAFARLGADAFTANPLLGRDALAPLVDGARADGAGVFVLVRTSNPGASDVLDLPLAGGEPLWERLAVLVAELGVRDTDPTRPGLADVGAVTGATVPEHLERMRELMPHAPFLLPGVGAQGGDVATLAPAFAPGRAGGLVTASRSIAQAADSAGGDPPAAARAEAERLRAAAWRLA
jgi:orotidine-5'-phosphate decarboxylase